ncbi:MAG TPA: CYTH domain-containing protein, partial [Streptosporangiaceae bacterium]|nr:CYTH domain-containing protein [Streptosporangiaceae bacterium]
MAIEFTEIERKYEAPQEAALPDLAGLPDVAGESDPEELTLRAQYYDTDDLRLLRHGITLRRRTGGGDAGWHLKLPLGGDGMSEPQGRGAAWTDERGTSEEGRRRLRGAPEASGRHGTEIRLPPGRSSRQVPAELAGLVRAFTRGAELRPVARITTVRQRRVLLDEAGDTLAEVADNDVTAQAIGDAATLRGGPWGSPLQGPTLSRWHEVEVELTRGGPPLLDAADRRLRAAGLRPAGRQAKL